MSETPPVPRGRLICPRAGNLWSLRRRSGRGHDSPHRGNFRDIGMGHRQPRHKRLLDRGGRRVGGELSVHRLSKRSSGSPRRLRPPNRHFDGISSASSFLASHRGAARATSSVGQRMDDEEFPCSFGLVRRMAHERTSDGKAKTRSARRDGLLPVPQTGMVIVSVTAKSRIHDAGPGSAPMPPSAGSTPDRLAPHVLLPPFWPWSTHIVQLGPVRIMQRARQPPPAPTNPINTGGRWTFRQQHRTDIRPCNRAHG
jgi:hypothetical protein